MVVFSAVHVALEQVFPEEADFTLGQTKTAINSFRYPLGYNPLDHGLFNNFQIDRRLSDDFQQDRRVLIASPVRVTLVTLRYNFPWLVSLSLDFHRPAPGGGFERMDLDAEVIRPALLPPGLRVLKVSAVNIIGSENAMSRLAGGIARLDHVCLAWCKAYWADILVKDGLKYVENLEMFGCSRDSFDSESYADILSEGSTVRSFTMQGAPDPSRIEHVVRNDNLEDLFSPASVIGYYSGFSWLRYFRVLKRLFLELRTEAKGRQLAELAANHPTLKEYTLLVLNTSPMDTKDTKEMQRKWVHALKTNKSITALRFQKTAYHFSGRLGRMELLGYESLVTAGMASELRVNQIGRDQPGEGGKDDWFSAIRDCCEADDFSALYHFVRASNIMLINNGAWRPEKRRRRA